MAIKKYKPTSPGRRFATFLQHEAVTKTEPEKALTEGLKKSGGRNVHGRVTSRHRGGGAKRRYRKIDFKRRKDGDSGEGRRDRVRPEPLGAHRAAALRGRREALHPGARPASTSATPSRPVPTRTSRPAAACRSRTSRPVRRSTTWSSPPAAAASSAAPPARRSSWSRRRAATRRCGCPRARCAWCSWTAAPRSACSATPSTSSSSWARPAARATAASARRRAAWR